MTDKLSDLDITRACAEMRGIDCTELAGALRINPYHNDKYDPLHDKAQAFELVERFRLHPIPDNDRDGWWDVFVGKPYSPTIYGSDPDLSRAICSCVAQMHTAKREG